MHRKLLISFFSMVVILSGVSACAPATLLATTPAAPHWTYEGEEGPAHWGSLSPAYAACSTGKSQSPVDISNPPSEDVTNIVFHYQPSELRIRNNGHTIEVQYAEGSYIELDGARYNLRQFHFHAPSEHSIQGELAEAELHLVHEHASAAGELAVVGVLIEAGAENPAFQSTWDNLPSTEGPFQQISVEVNAADMLPAVKRAYRYDGSLTTPPCTEGVKWNVMVDPIEMSESQLIAFTQIVEGNNRPVQSLNERTLIEDITP